MSEQLRKIIEELYDKAIKDYLGPAIPLTEHEKAKGEALWKEYRDSRHNLHKQLLAKAEFSRAVVLKAVIELHRPSSGQYHIHCQGCDSDGWDSEPPEYPCRTIELIKEKIL